MQDQIFAALTVATQAHTGQYRKGTHVPYIIHPLNVSKILIEYGCDEAVVIAGLLHDTVEDTSLTLADIEAQFGHIVAHLVDATSESDKTDSWENRKQHTLDFLKTASHDVLLITCADKLDNVRTMRVEYERLGEPFWQRFNRPKQKQHWYYQNLATIFFQRAWDEPSRQLFTTFQRDVRAVFGSDTDKPSSVGPPRYRGSLHHVTIAVHNLNEAVAFYKTTLGFSPLETPPDVMAQGIRWFDLGQGRMLHLIESPEKVQPTRAHFALAVDNVSAWKNYLESLSVELVQPKVQLYGMARVFVRDPSGNLLEFVEWVAP